MNLTLYFTALIVNAIVWFGAGYAVHGAVESKRNFRAWQRLRDDHEDFPEPPPF